MNFQLYKPFFRFFSALYLFFFFSTMSIKYFTFPCNLYSPLCNFCISNTTDNSSGNCKCYSGKAIPGNCIPDFSDSAYKSLQF